MYIVCFLLITAAVTSEIQGAESIAVTIYNDGFGIVKDVRNIKFDQGESTLYFTDVAENIQTETVTFKALDNAQSVRVYEQNFEKNLIQQSAILKKYIEKQVDVVAEFANEAKRIRGVLLASSPSVILQTDRGIVIANKISAIDLASIPDGFFTMPTLNWKVASEVAQTQKCEVTYRTTGFSWKSDYIVTINEQETKADMGGWITIDNNSGKKYQNAKLKLIAGDVNVVRPPIYAYATFSTTSINGTGSGNSFSQKSFSDYHMYTLGRLVTLNQSSQKQVQFIPKVYGIDIRKFNQIKINSGGYSQQNIPASNQIRFNNTKAVGLGIPLPKGTVRVFKQDEADKSLQFIGEDSISHTPRDENVTLSIGNAFDIRTDLVAKDRVNYNDGGYRSTMVLTVTNHKQVPAQIEVSYNNFYGNNLSIGWQESNLAKLEKVSASEYKIVKVFQPNEKVEYKWTENYQI